MRMGVVSQETLDKLHHNLKEDIEGRNVWVMFSEGEAVLAKDTLKAVAGLLTLYAERSDRSEVQKSCNGMATVVQSFIERVFQDSDPFAGLDESEVN